MAGWTRGTNCWTRGTNCWTKCVDGVNCSSSTLSNLPDYIDLYLSGISAIGSSYFAYDNTYDICVDSPTIDATWFNLKTATLSKVSSTSSSATYSYTNDIDTTTEIARYANLTYNLYSVKGIRISYQISLSCSSDTLNVTVSAFINPISYATTSSFSLCTPNSSFSYGSSPIGAVYSYYYSGASIEGLYGSYGGGAYAFAKDRAWDGEYGTAIISVS